MLGLKSNHVSKMDSWRTFSMWTAVSSYQVKMNISRDRVGHFKWGLLYIGNIGYGTGIGNSLVPQATSYYLDHWWPSNMAPYSVPRPHYLDWGSKVLDDIVNAVIEPVWAAVSCLNKLVSPNAIVWVRRVTGQTNNTEHKYSGFQSPLCTCVCWRSVCVYFLE